MASMERDKPEPHAAGQLRPDPDPTVLTTASLLREISNLRTELISRIQGIEKSIIVSHDDLVRVPTQVDKAVQGLRDLAWSRFDQVSERFNTNTQMFENIQTQFSERDKRVEQTARDSKVAIDAALSAQEKAASERNVAFSLSIDKSEKFTTKTIDALGLLLSTTTGNLDGKITELKDRLTGLDGRSTGRSDVWGWVVAGAVALVAVASYLGHGLR